MNFKSFKIIFLVSLLFFQQIPRVYALEEDTELEVMNNNSDDAKSGLLTKLKGINVEHRLDSVIQDIEDSEDSKTFKYNGSVIISYKLLLTFTILLQNYLAKIKENVDPETGNNPDSIRRLAEQFIDQKLEKERTSGLPTQKQNRAKRIFTKFFTDVKTSALVTNIFACLGQGTTPVVATVGAVVLMLLCGVAPAAISLVLGTIWQVLNLIITGGASTGLLPSLLAPGPVPDPVCPNGLTSAKFYSQRDSLGFPSDKITFCSNSSLVHFSGTLEGNSPIKMQIVFDDDPFSQFINATGTITLQSNGWGQGQIMAPPNSLFYFLYNTGTPYAQFLNETLPLFGASGLNPPLWSYFSWSANSTFVNGTLFNATFNGNATITNYYNNTNLNNYTPPAYNHDMLIPVIAFYSAMLVSMFLACCGSLCCCAGSLLNGAGCGIESYIVLSPVHSFCCLNMSQIFNLLNFVVQTVFQKKKKTPEYVNEESQELKSCPTGLTDVVPPIRSELKASMLDLSGKLIPLLEDKKDKASDEDDDDDITEI